MGIRFRKQTRRGFGREGARGLPAFISLRGFQAVIKQIWVLSPSLPSFPQPPLVSCCLLVQK